MAQCSAPPSNPANNAFFRLSAIGRMERSTVLFDAAIVDEARQAFPTRQGVTDGFGSLLF